MGRHKFVSPNPKFLAWLREWETEAKAKDMKHMVFTCRKAIASLSKFPLKLATGAECRILEGFGPILCKRLDARLAQSATDDDEVEFEPTTQSGETETEPPQQSTVTSRSRKRAAAGDTSAPSSPTTRVYRPTVGTSSWALLVALHRNASFDKDSACTKRRLSELAEPLCHSATFAPASYTGSSAPNAFYTGWSSMGTLVKKGLVEKCARLPDQGLAGFWLSASGRVLAESVNCDQSDNLPEPTLTSPPEQIHHSSQPLPPVSFHEQQAAEPVDASRQVVLLIDLAEISRKNCKEVITKSLQKAGFREYAKSPHSSPDAPLLYEFCRLSVGDFAWVYRRRHDDQLTPSETSDTDLMLDLIIERKRYDDLAHSIVSGRYKEQKCRLRSCGIPRVVYLLEKHGSLSTQKLPEASLRQSIATTLVADGFMMKHSVGLADTVEFVCAVSRNLNAFPRIAPGHQTFEAFNRAALKSGQLTVRHTFGLQLMQLAGVSNAKVSSLLDLFPTPMSLITFVSDQDPASAAKYLASNTNLSLNICKSIVTLYS